MVAGMTKLYIQDDAQEILRRAIARQVDTAEVTRAELIEIAQEIGISLADLNWAEQDWTLAKQEQQERELYQRYRQKDLRQHGIKFLIVNTFFVALNLVTSGGLGWSLYVMWGWGLALTLHVWRTYQTDSPRYEQKFQRWRRSQQLQRSLGRWLDRLLSA